MFKKRGATMNSPQDKYAPDSVQATEASYLKSSVEMVFPATTTVKGRVLGALLRGESLTHLDCWRRFGSSRLSHHIYSLRGDGWAITVVDHHVTTSDANRTATIGVYSLDDPIIASASEAGQRYAAETLKVERERREAH